MDLFETSSASAAIKRAPLADRMRPRTLDEFIGQEEILGKGKLLRRAIEADRISSVIFYGPPGCGKTTLAKIIANTTKSHFITINAVLAGKADIVEAINEARDTFSLHSRRTILFVDEVHRFNKAQQDALLPHVESGTLILIGATTENPYFEVNKALVSRSRIFRLTPLDENDLRKIIYQALEDCVRGYGSRKVSIENDAAMHLCNTSNGDARSVLNALELAVETTKPDANERIIINLETAQQSIQRRAVLYDKDGDAHYDVISAFIKSVRGSDPDAALFWLAKMIYAGEDPRFIFRRMLILASEDVGLADPQAVGVVASCASSYDYIGMPEGRYPLSQACLYLATAPKSNSTMAFFDALKCVEEEDKADDIPDALRDANRDADGFSHGAGYLYPHSYRQHWVNQQYLPDNLRAKVFYIPSDSGYECKIGDEVRKRREIQIEAAMFEDENAKSGGGASSLFERAVSGADIYAESVRRDLFDIASVGRSDLVLDINCGANGFLSLEALRRSTSAGVWAYALSKEDGENFKNFTQKMSYLDRPEIRFGKIWEICDKTDVKFDRIISRGVPALIEEERLAEFAGKLRLLLKENGRIAFVQYVPAQSTLLSDFVSEKFCQAVKAAQNQTFEKTPLGRFLPDRFSRIFIENGFAAAEIKKQYSVRRRISQKTLDEWFRDDENSFGTALKRHTSAQERREIEGELRRVFTAGETQWNMTDYFWDIRDKT